MKFLVTSAVTLFSLSTYAQTQQVDSLKLNEVNINSISKQRDIARLDSINGTFIFSGKKTEVEAIVLSGTRHLALRCAYRIGDTFSKNIGKILNKLNTSK